MPEVRHAAPPLDPDVDPDDYEDEDEEDDADAGEDEDDDEDEGGEKWYLAGGTNKRDTCAVVPR